MLALVTFRLYVFIVAQIVQVAQPMLFKWTWELGQSVWKKKHGLYPLNLNWCTCSCSQALNGPHHYQIADQGGLLVAVSADTATPKEVKFSTDEGRCWHKYPFTDENVVMTGEVHWTLWLWNEYFIITILTGILHWCPDCLICSANTIWMGWTAWIIWAVPLVVNRERMIHLNSKDTCLGK